MNKKRWLWAILNVTLIVVVIAIISIILVVRNGNLNDGFAPHKVGAVIDSFNGVSVYYNGSVGNKSGRHRAADGYNLGLKYQCVEFVKRYYYEALHHKMPNSWGNAIDFFNPKLSDGEFNAERGLTQYANPSQTKPEVHDILIYDGSGFNPYGHVSIVAEVTDNEIEIIQQNSGLAGITRERFGLEFSDGLWKIKHSRILGRLHKSEGLVETQIPSEVRATR